MMHDSNSGKAVDHIRKKKYKELPVCAVYDDDNNNAQRVIDDILCYARLDLPEYYIRALICECYWFCNEIIYDVRKSEAKWPRANTLADFLSLYVVGKPDHLAGKAYRHLMNRTQAANETEDSHGVDTVGEIFDKLSNISFPSEAEQAWVYNNFFQINLFFRDMVVVEHLQEPAFNTGGFLLQHWRSLWFVGRGVTFDSLRDHDFSLETFSPFMLPRRLKMNKSKTYT